MTRMLLIMRCSRARVGTIVAAKSWTFSVLYDHSSKYNGYRRGAGGYCAGGGEAD